MIDVIGRELIYILYSFEIQLRRIFSYWELSMVLGSLIAFFAKEKIHSLFAVMRDKTWDCSVSFLPVFSAFCRRFVCTVPHPAGGFVHDGIGFLKPAAYHVFDCSWNKAGTLRIITCFLWGIAAGLLVHFCYRKKDFFNFDGFAEPKNRDTAPNPFMRFLKNRTSAAASFMITGPATNYFYSLKSSVSIFLPANPSHTVQHRSASSGTRATINAVIYDNRQLSTARSQCR